MLRDTMDVDGVSCDRCRAQRALVRCAQDAACLCLPCDVAVHAAASSHERAPLCDGCHTGRAVARCDVHGAALCASCARKAACDAERHSRRHTGTYTGFPDLAELARIFAVDDYIHMITELSSDSLMEDAINPDNDKIGEVMGATAALLINDGDEHFTQQGSWPKLDDGGLDVSTIHDSINLSNSVDSIGHTEGTFEESSSLDYDHPLTSSWSELIMPTEADLLQPLTKNNTAYEYDEFSIISANTSTSMPISLSDLTAGSSSVTDCQDQEPLQVALPEKSSRDPEARMKQEEKRQRAKQRYNDKKKNRRFSKQIMYASRKATADTRKRFKGRFAKASTSAVLKSHDKSLAIY